MLKYLKGDKSIWILCILFAIASLLMVFSSSSNLAYTQYGGNVSTILIKHFLHLSIGLCLMVVVSNIPYKYFYNSSIILFFLALALLLIALFTGNEIANANARRWVRVFGFTFQPSELAKVVLIMLLARNLVKYKGKFDTFKKSIIPVLLPIGAICALILPSNFSSSAYIFVISLILLFLGKYPIKYLLSIIGVGVVSLGLFIGLVLTFPNISNRVDTWKGRIERHLDGDTEEQYQVQHAKTAIALGGWRGVGPGKSKEKYFLPQSSSDFIFAIIVEEYGFFGALTIITLYLLLLLRMLLVAYKAADSFGALVAAAIGISIFFQAMLNMGVSVNLLPVTGQNLPLISSGGSSVWMTCLALGMVLSVSYRSLEIKKREEERAKMMDFEADHLGEEADLDITDSVNCPEENEGELKEII